MAGSAPPDALWYKDAIFYELHVKAYADSSGDGVGDFRGLAGRLDHLKDLGVDCIWLLPMYPSPFRDDGYDISDYYAIHPQHASIEDFRELLKAAHARGLRVITELVLNHTSDQHPWFQEARRAVDDPRRDWYVWSDSDEKYAGVRIIFKDTERSNWAWDPVSKAHYWHRFFSHQPDLNFDNPVVREEIWNVMAFWLEQGVDGFRVDAVPYLQRGGAEAPAGIAVQLDEAADPAAQVDQRLQPGHDRVPEARQPPSAGLRACPRQRPGAGREQPVEHRPGRGAGPGRPAGAPSPSRCSAAASSLASESDRTC
jgi:glycosidase